MLSYPIDYRSPYTVGYVFDAVLNFQFVQLINSVVVFSALGFYRETQSIRDILGWPKWLFQFFCNSLLLFFFFFFNLASLARAGGPPAVLSGPPCTSLLPQFLEQYLT